MTSPSDLNKVFEIILELPGITVTDVVIEDNAYHVHCTSIFEDAYLSQRSNANRTLGGESQEIR